MKENLYMTRVAAAGGVYAMELPVTSVRVEVISCSAVTLPDVYVPLPTVWLSPLQINEISSITSPLRYNVEAAGFAKAGTAPQSALGWSRRRS